MKKNILLVLVVIAAAVAGFSLFGNRKASAPVADENLQKSAEKSAEQAQKQIQNNQSNNSKKMELQIKTIQEGKGDREVKAGDTVSVLYTGKLEDGTVFDASSRHGNQPFDFKVGAGMVIKGWDQGLLGAKVGEKRELTIPSDLGYGQSGIPGVIPPNATLIFEVDVLSIK